MRAKTANTADRLRPTTQELRMPSACQCSHRDNELLLTLSTSHGLTVAHREATASLKPHSAVRTKNRGVPYFKYKAHKEMLLGTSRAVQKPW